LFLEKLATAHKADKLKFFAQHAGLADATNFASFLAPHRKAEWVVYAKQPFAGPKAVLAYLSRYTHRVAISNSRLISTDGNDVTFKWKDYRNKATERQKTMTLTTHEFIRRFLIHVLPHRFHRIRHTGLFANGNRADNIAKINQLLRHPNEPDTATQDETNTDGEDTKTCPCCGGRMITIETFEPGCKPRYWPPPAARQASEAPPRGGKMKCL